MNISQAVVDAVLDDAKKYNRIYIASVHPDISESDLRTVFEPFGDILKVQLAKQHSGQGHRWVNMISIFLIIIIFSEVLAILNSAPTKTFNRLWKECKALIWAVKCFNSVNASRLRNPQIMRFQQRPQWLCLWQVQVSVFKVGLKNWRFLSEKEKFWDKIVYCGW